MDIKGRITRNAQGSSHINAESGSLLLSRHVFAYQCARNFLPDGGRILEIGPGEGFGSGFFGDDYDYYTLDLSLQTLSELEHDSPRVCGDGSRLPFKNDSFDAVIAFQVIEHVPDPETFLRELDRTRAPDGSVLLTTPNRKHRLLDDQEPWNPHHLREYSAESLSSLVEAELPDATILGIDAPPQVREQEFARLPSVVENLAMKYVPQSGVARSLAGLFRLGGELFAESSSSIPVSPEQFVMTDRSFEEALDFLVVSNPTGGAI